METKPYRIQSPEDIAKDYGGNKQKIAEAMQMGIVDPTAGVLAGMFIDRMRSAQMQEAAPKPTVAQQVMGGPPAQAPLAPTGGLGATAPAMPPMAPEAGIGAPPMEAPMPEEAPMGMAAGGFVPPYMKSGGLSELPVPDTMFDENRDGSYAGGGIVAFAQGDEAKANPLGWLYAPITSLYGAKRSTGAHQGQDFAVGKRTPIGAPAPGKVVKAATDDINGNFVVVRHPDGTTSSYSHLDEITVGEGEDVKSGQVLGLSGKTGRVRGKNGGYHLHFGARDAEGNRINPTDFFKQIAPQVASGKFSQRLPERDLGTAQGRVGSLEDFVGVAQRFLKPGEDELALEEKARKRFEEQASDEYYEKQRKDSMWETLATMGFNMASSKAPGLLQAIGEAANAALPGAKADKKERKELKDRALDGLMALGARNRQRANEAFKVGVDLYRSGVEAQQAEDLMKYRYAALQTQISEGALNRAADIERQRIAATSRDTMFEQIANTLEATIRQRLDQGLPIRNVGGGFITFPKGKRPSDEEIRALAQRMAIAEVQKARGSAGAGSTQDITQQLRASQGDGGSAPSYEGFSATQVGG